MMMVQLRKSQSNNRDSCLSLSLSLSCCEGISPYLSDRVMMARGGNNSKRRRKKMDWFLCPGTRKAIHSSVWCGGGERKKIRKGEHRNINGVNHIRRGKCKRKKISCFYICYFFFFLFFFFEKIPAGSDRDRLATHTHTKREGYMDRKGVKRLRISGRVERNTRVSDCLSCASDSFSLYVLREKSINGAEGYPHTRRRIFSFRCSTTHKKKSRE